MRAGETLGGKYVLDQLLGRGGMGVVWSAYDLQTQQKVAIKLILPQNEETLTKELRQRLIREAGACAKLQHPNIIQVHEVGETDEGDAYMVLELLHGQALGDLLKQKRRLEPKLAARIAAEIASGLAVAHAAKVVHRDLKPANIYLHREPGLAEDEFVTKILDFGVCIDRESMDTIKTRFGFIVGSPAYMSPEQVMMRKDLDGRSDIWSLGLVLYEMVTGMRAFSGHVDSMPGQILTQPVPAPSSKVRDIPPDLDAVVARCTQGKRELRYAEASELARDLYIIAGVKPARQPSTSRPSAVKEIGLAGMFNEEIQATPVVPKPGGPRTFNPGGATLPLIPPERRAEVEALPPVIDEVDDLVATLPMQAQKPALERPKPLDEQGDTAAGTQFMRADAPIPSPDPEWKREMEQALEVHRQSSMSLPLIPIDAQQDVAGGTQMLSLGVALGVGTVRSDMPIRLDASGTTSVAGTMSQEVRGSSKSVPEPVSVTGRRRRTGRRTLMVATAVLMTTVVLMVGAIAYRHVREEAKAVQPDVSARVAMPLPPVTSDAVVPAVSSSEPVPPSAPVVLPSASAGLPGATATAPAVTATNAPSAAPVVPTSAGTNASVVPKKASGPVAPSKPVAKPKKMIEVCTGVGVFRRCKEVPAP